MGLRLNHTVYLLFFFFLASLAAAAASFSRCKQNELRRSSKATRTAAAQQKHFHRSVQRKPHLLTSGLFRCCRRLDFGHDIVLGARYWASDRTEQRGVLAPHLRWTAGSWWLVFQRLLRRMPAC